MLIYNVVSRNDDDDDDDDDDDRDWTVILQLLSNLLII